MQCSSKPDNQLITVNEVADRLQVSRRTVYRLADLGQLPKPMRIGSLIRWKEVDINTWIEDGCSTKISNRKGA